MLHVLHGLHVHSLNLFARDATRVCATVLHHPEPAFFFGFSFGGRRENPQSALVGCPASQSWLELWVRPLCSETLDAPCLRPAG